MKYHLILLLALIVAVSVQGQEYTSSHINKSDGSGRKQGLWRVYDGNGNLKFEGNYANDRPMGEFRYFFPNGKTKAIVNNLDSGRVSYVKMFYQGGQLMAAGKYTGQQKDSSWTFYSELDGTLVSEEQYAGGSAAGTWKSYYPSGQVAEEYAYVNGKKEGEWIQYFSDGVVKSHGTYRDGMLDGLYVINHLNGSVQVSGSYAMSKKTGAWVYLSEIGELEKREEYKNGVLIRQYIPED